MGSRADRQATQAAVPYTRRRRLAITPGLASPVLPFGPGIGARASSIARRSSCAALETAAAGVPGAAVDGDGLAVHIFRQRMQQVDREIGQLAHLADPAHRVAGRWRPPSPSAAVPGLSLAQAPSVGKGPGAMALKRMPDCPTPPPATGSSRSAPPWTSPRAR